MARVLTWFKYTVIRADEKGYVIERMTEKSETNGKPTNIGGGGNWDGVILTFTLNKKFRVQKVDGIEKGIRKVAGENEDLRGALTANITPETMSVGVESLFRAMPDEPVKIGDKWTRTFHQTLGTGMGSLKIDAGYKFAESRNGIEKIAIGGEIKYVPLPRNPDAMAKITNVVFTAEEYEGDYVFDSKSGRLLSHSLSSKNRGKMTLSTNGKESEGTFQETSKTKYVISDKSLVKE